MQLLCFQGWTLWVQRKTAAPQLTLPAPHHQAGCYGCTATGSFWGTALWAGAEHLDTSQPGPSKCPYETGGRSGHTPPPRWWANICGQKERQGRIPWLLLALRWRDSALSSGALMVKRVKKTCPNPFQGSLTIWGWCFRHTGPARRDLPPCVL